MGTRECERLEDIWWNEYELNDSGFRRMNLEGRLDGFKPEKYYESYLLVDAFSRPNSLIPNGCLVQEYEDNQYTICNAMRYIKIIKNAMQNNTFRIIKTN